MKTSVVCYDEEAPVLAIYEFLCRVSIRGIIVVSDGRPTGIINRSSLLRWFCNAAKVSNSKEIEEHSAAADKPVDDPRSRVLKTIRDLSDQASTMQSRLEDNTVDVQPCVIGCVSRIQEIINDLLAYSRFTGDPGQADDPTFSLPTDRAEQDSDGTTSETGTLPDFTDQLTDPSIWFPPGCEPDVLSASEPST